ncbi:MAG: DUF167 domain-containing protein [Armatimonadetes bacterium]|nr:DUF167 domain-containing protein [Armatimonadota bacterium]
MAKSEPNEASLNVKVAPRASRTQVSLQPDGSVKVWVTAPPADGQANEAVIEALSRALSTAKSNLEITRGHSGRDKIVKVLGLSAAEVQRRLSD